MRKSRSPALLGVGCLSIKQHLLIPAFLFFSAPPSFGSFSFSCQYCSFWILELLIITISNVTIFLVFLFFLSCMASDHGLYHTLATIFSVKHSQGHTAVLNQTTLGYRQLVPRAESWKMTVCPPCSQVEEYIPQLCEFLWIQKPRMFLFVFSDALCLDVKAARKKKNNQQNQKPNNKHYFS